MSALSSFLACLSSRQFNSLSQFPPLFLPAAGPRRRPRLNVWCVEALGARRLRPRVHAVLRHREDPRHGGIAVYEGRHLDLSPTTEGVGIRGGGQDLYMSLATEGVSSGCGVQY